MPRKNPPARPARRGAPNVPKAELEHPGLAVIPEGRPEPGTCTHPPQRRDGKNKNLCRACGTEVQADKA